MSREAEAILSALLDIRRRVKAGNPPDTGLCSAFYTDIEHQQGRFSRKEAAQWFGEAMWAWPDLHTWPSGGLDPNYPVDGRREYDKAKAMGTLWDNPRRLALLDWMCRYFGGDE